MEQGPWMHNFYPSLSLSLSFFFFFFFFHSVCVDSTGFICKAVCQDSLGVPRQSWRAGSGLS